MNAIRVLTLIIYKEYSNKCLLFLNFQVKTHVIRHISAAGTATVSRVGGAVTMIVTALMDRMRKIVVSII